MKRTVLFLALAASGNANACYNDRDTLGFELRDRPDVQRALTGRFERNPPLYYRMRVARLQALPSLTAAEHDDLAVALDRLGRSDEGLAALDPRVLRTADDRYRFFANRGTLRAHRWLRRGARRAELHELQVAVKDIARALTINPNAHFGREAVQLETLRWFERPKTKEGYDESLGRWLEERVKSVDPVVGLSGLIMLGGAWESPDVAPAIAELSNGPKTFSTAELAYDRYRELRALSGHPVGNTEAEEGGMELQLGLTPPPGEPPVMQSFRKLRTEADAWNHDRTAFMLARLKAGRHPDTDPTFWQGWRDTPMPRLDPGAKPKPSEVRFRWALAAVAGLGVVLFVVTFLVIGWMVRWFTRWRA